MCHIELNYIKVGPREKHIKTTAVEHVKNTQITIDGHVIIRKTHAEYMTYNLITYLVHA